MRQFVIPASILGLSLLSLITLSSISPGLAPRQLTFFLIGGIVFFLVSKIPFVRLLESSWIWYLALCVLLILILIFGEETRGTARWLELGSLFVIQGSQLAVPVVALLLASWLNKKSAGKIEKFDQLLKILAIIAIPAGLILIEPDLGTTVAYILSLGVAFLFIKIKKVFIIYLLALTLVGSFLGWNFLLRDYQKERITSFVSKQDFQGANYNAHQALIAVGSGKLLGRGLGQGVQSHLRFLPERQTDFIFASFSEEFGFIGAVVLISLYVLMITSIMKIGISAESQAEFLFCMFMAGMIAVQTGINIGMNIGILPITGITLPLFSSGGSSVVSTLTALGIVQGINSQRNKRPNLSFS